MIIDTLCAGCDLFARVNDLGLCDDCFAKLERDLIRARDWDYSATAFITPAEDREALRNRVIHKHGAAYELIVPPDAQPKKKRKNKRSNSRNTKRKRAIAAQAIRDYDTDDVLQAARTFIQARDEEWVNFSRVSQHLHERFYKLKPRHLGRTGTRYKSLLKLLADYPEHFEVKHGEKGIFWIRLA